MISRDPPPKNNPYDVIIISGDYWADHPSSGIGIIARVLDSKGYNVGIIEKPPWGPNSSAEYLRLGMPRLFFGVSSGAVDSMLQNYTPLKKLRKNDKYKPYDSKIPDRAVIVYVQKLKECQNIYIKKNNLPESFKRPIVIGGVEASLRRFTHYDYWDNGVRRPIIIDAKADILVYGPGEYQIVEIARRIENHQSLYGIDGTCIVSSDKTAIESLLKEDRTAKMLPSHEMAASDKKIFARMQLLFSNKYTLIQPVGDRFVIQFKQHNYSTDELDEIYSMNFTYNIPEEFKQFKMAQFSITTHRGCFGNCSFCSIALHQGDKIISRSEGNIIKEIERMKIHPAFKGYIYDLGGPSANMYGMDCELSNKCETWCLPCNRRDKSHSRLIKLLKRARSIPGIKKVFVRSGIRFDLAMEADQEYLEELLRHHISGYLKIAPEHVSTEICALMNKPIGKFKEFLKKFEILNEKLGRKWHLKYYFITAHPGSTMRHARILARAIRKLGRIDAEKVQIFTPTPMSISTCMYYTGLDPRTMKKVYVPYSYREKKEQKRILFKDGI